MVRMELRKLAHDWIWRGEEGGVEVVFVGKGEGGERAEVLARVTGERRVVAWVEQEHGNQVRTGREGSAGPGDAVVTAEVGLALAVLTADCVPVVLAGSRGVAVAHAGWRGIARRVVGEAARRLEEVDGGRQQWRAWIGPAIGPCCYEVGADVAEAVAAASGPEVIVPGGAKPNLDLAAAVRLQLAEAGVGRVLAVGGCTKCDAERLWSYRREGRTGRNLAFAWRRSGN